MIEIIITDYMPIHKFRLDFSITAIDMYKQVSESQETVPSVVTETPREDKRSFCTTQ